MSEITPFLALTKPGGGSTGLITPPDRVDIDVLNDNFQKIDDWAADWGTKLTRSFAYYGPAASIGSVTPAPKDGDTYQESDGDKRFWRRVGGNWVTAEQGMYLLRPTTANLVNATVNAAGEVVPNAAASFSVNNIFTSRFREYLIKFALKATVSASFQAVARVGGVDLTSASYVTQGHNSNGGAVSAASGTIANLSFSAAASGYVAGTLDLSNIATAAAKKTARINAGSDTTLSRIVSAYLTGVDANAYDGITFSVTAGTFDTGHANYIKIYGLA